MKLGKEIGLGAGHIVLDRQPAPPERGTAAPGLFGPCLLWPNGRPSQPLLSTYHFSRFILLLAFLGSGGGRWGCVYSKGILLIILLSGVLLAVTIFVALN